MHQTLTQVLMPPIDVSASRTSRKLPPKSLLFKGEDKGSGSNTNENGRGSKTGRASPKLSQHDGGVNIVNQKALQL